MRPLFAEFCADADDAEARTMLAFSLFVGSNFMAASHGGRSRAQVMRLATDRLLSERWTDTETTTSCVSGRNRPQPVVEWT